METPNERGPQGTPHGEEPDAAIITLSTKADLSKRVLAAFIDFVIAIVLSRIPYVGWFTGIGYVLVRDGLDLEFMNRKSIGKKLMGLKTIRLDGEAMDVAVSVRRNWMFALGTLASLVVWIPILGFLTVLAAALISFVIGVYEVYLVFNDLEGRRWGDTFAGTKVVEVDE